MYSTPQNSYYQYPYGQQYQRPVQMEPSQTMANQYNMPPMMSQTGNYIKGRPVASFDEARAAQIDFDGSLHVFTDIGNKKIYTKQINLDGTATLNTYTLVEEDVASNAPEYVTKSEFNQALMQIEAIINSKESEKKTALNNF